MQAIMNRLINCINIQLITVISAMVFCNSNAYALKSSEILVIANERQEDSIDLARYYMKQRNIPEKQLLLVSVSLEETISREEYDRFLVSRIQKKITELGIYKINTLVCIYGIPLRVQAKPLTETEKKKLAHLEKQIQDMKSPKKQKAIGEQEELEKQKKSIIFRQQHAAVDSELALVMAGNYSLDGWIANPYFTGYQGKATPVQKEQVLLVSRLDGPDAGTVRRIIDDALAVEKTGLQGIAYFDARYPLPRKNPEGIYAFYDATLHHAGQLLTPHMAVQIDDKEDLFPPNSCPEASLYAGWYSLNSYIDSFSWRQGAIGYHLASGECTTLKQKNGTNWCLGMLRRGVAATIGPVDEPYLDAFPPPDMFFSLLVKANLTLGESYLYSLPYLSWQMILIGDPLYRPFPAKN